MNPHDDGITFRPARSTDGRDFPDLVARIGTLESNSSYCYLLMTRMFGDTCAVAEYQGKSVGFVLGFRPPTSPDSVFVWQVGVIPEMCGKGLATGLLLQLLGQTKATFIEATVGLSNQSSRALFANLAKKLGAHCQIDPYFLTEHFPDPHEEEHLFRIGPLDPEAPNLYRSGLSQPATVKGDATR